MNTRLAIGAACAILPLLGLANERGLMAAAHRCDEHQVRYWLSNGVSPNAQSSHGDRPLHFAAYQLTAGDGGDDDELDHRPSQPKDLQACKRIVVALKARRADTEARNERGWTPLMVAAMNGHAPVVEGLLIARAKPDTHNPQNGRRAVHYAADFGEAEVIAILARRRADLDAQDRAGDTALHATALSDQPKAARALLDAGANRHARNNAGETPLDVAQMWEHQEVAEILRKP